MYEMEAWAWAIQLEAPFRSRLEEKCKKIARTTAMNRSRNSLSRDGSFTQALSALRPAVFPQQHSSLRRI
jgi:hypothetical protein